MKELLRLANEWWTSKAISEEKAKPYRRKQFKELLDLLEYRQVVILTGLRRVGKSTLLFQLISELLKKVNEKTILYFNFDERTAEPLEALKDYGEITGTDWKKETCFIFFDEIQKVRDWSSKIKMLHDNLPNLRIFVSGSASLLLESQAISNLSGRYFALEIPPLSLREFAEIYLGKDINRLELYRDEIKKLFPLYIKRPFPEIVKWTDERRVYEYVKELVVDKVLRVDLPNIFKINISLLSTLAELFLRDPGTILNLTDLAKDLKVHKLTLESHLFYLEFAKVIRIIKNFRPSVRAESRKMPKVYPFHISLSFPYYPSLDKGNIFETLIAPKARNYWREGFREIDFIERDKQLLPVEVKSTENLKKEDFRNLLYFAKKYKVKEARIVYAGRNQTKSFDSVKVDLVNVIDFLWS